MRRCISFQVSYLFWLLPACQQKTTLMLCFSDALYQSSISFIALTILTNTLSSLQKGLKIVQYQQQTKLVIAGKRKIGLVRGRIGEAAILGRRPRE